jgi:hypothetical protein
MRAQYKINFDRPPRLKNLFRGNNYSGEIININPRVQAGRTPDISGYIQTDRHKFTNRNLDRLYITRPKRLGTSKRRHAILHVKNSVLPSAAIHIMQFSLRKSRIKITSLTLTWKVDDSMANSQYASQHIPYIFY